MAEFWPVVFSLAQVAQAVCLIRLSSLTQRAKPFTHIVCLPGDVVCIGLPADMSEREVARMKSEADRFQDETGARMCIFKGGVQIFGMSRPANIQEFTHD